MRTIYIGSARIDERGKASGGAAGDQTGKEIAEQKFYVHKKGWVVLRLINEALRPKLAEAMIRACNNNNIGYDQNERGGVIKNGTKSPVKTEADCSSLVRECVREVTGTDPGNFTTINMKSALLKTNLFKVVIGTDYDEFLEVGDVLVTRTKGHTAIVTRIDGEIDKPEVIKIGAKGPKVRDIQKKLCDEGFPVMIDGAYGPNTYCAVIAYQGLHSLKKDGIVGPKTWKEMFG